MAASYFWGTGRRKNAVARVHIAAGEGKFLINGRETSDYLPRHNWMSVALSPLTVTGLQGKVDVFVNAEGGGLTGQSGAICLGLSRALLKMNPDLRSVLKKAGLLTRDPRMVERKKFGQKGARAKYQFSKR